MSEQGHIKFVDYGFAKQLKSTNQKCHTNCGTPQYVAPEILMGIGHSFKADIWSLGVLIFEIQSGQTPFQAETVLQIFEKVNSCQVNYNWKIKSNLGELLDRIFVTDPEQRIGLPAIKQHLVFKVSFGDLSNNFIYFLQDIYWDIPMSEHFRNNSAPFVP